MSTVKDLKDYKKDLYASQTRELESFEKNFILIASGILAFSVTFIKEIVKIDEATLLFFLFAGWSLIICAVGLMMWAFLKSANASTELSRHVDDFLAARNKFDPADTLDANDIKDYKQESSVIFQKNKGQLKSLRFWAVRTFILGVLSFSFFVGFNLLQEKKHKHKEELKDKNCCCNHCQLPPKDTKVQNSTNDTCVTINYNICRDEKGEHSDCGCKDGGQDDGEGYPDPQKGKGGRKKKWHSKS